MDIICSKGEAGFSLSILVFGFVIAFEREGCTIFNSAVSSHQFHYDAIGLEAGKKAL